MFPISKLAVLPSRKYAPSLIFVRRPTWKKGPHSKLTNKSYKSVQVPRVKFGKPIWQSPIPSWNASLLPRSEIQTQEKMLIPIFLLCLEHSQAPLSAASVRQRKQIKVLNF